MNSNDNPAGPWRTSRHSNGQAECVQVAQPRTGTIAVRDSKDPGGPRLAFGPGQWRAFAAHVKATASTA
ncbi:MAG: DUF397 domain-containing protein [Streptosporangiaceae bacterium]